MSVFLHLAGSIPLVQVIWSAASVQPEGQAHEKYLGPTAESRQI